MGAVSVGMIDDKFVINPTVEQVEKSKLYLVVAGTKDAILMVEAGAEEITEDKMLDAILFGHEEIKKIIEFQEEIIGKLENLKWKLKKEEIEED